MKNPALAQLLFRAFEKVNDTEVDFGDKTIELWFLLKKLFRELTKTENIPFSSELNLIAFVCHKYQISAALQWRIYQLRRKANDANFKTIPITEQQYGISLKTAAYAVASFCKTKVPDDLNALLPEKDEDADYKKIEVKKRLESLRVIMVGMDFEKEHLICKPFDEPHLSILVKYNELAKNENFNDSILILKNQFKGLATVYLIDIIIDEDGIYYPKAFVLEPDYMIDVSAISESFQSFGASADLYLLKKFLPFSNSVPLMLGNIANFFLDELMTNPEVTFVDTFPKVFSLNPLAFVMFTDREIREIQQKSQKHFASLKMVIKTKLSEANISPEHCYLEPSFYSEKYGIQGRLDIWHKNENEAAIIELKSGKPFRANHLGLSHNHYTQTNLYDLLVRSVFNTEETKKSSKHINPQIYILYSGLDTEQLKHATPSKTQQSEAIKLRNQIIGIEKQLADLDENPLSNYTFIDQLKPSRLPQAKGYTARDLQSFALTIERATPLERLYFLSFVSFTAKEQQLAKTGSFGADKRNGLAALWLNEWEEKEDSFDVLGYLKIKDTPSNETNSMLSFERSNKTNPLANFRQGDIVVLYPFITEEDNVLRNQIFKGSIASIDSESITLQLYSEQFNDSLFKQDIFWHIERDMMESSFRVQYRALYAFLNAKQHHRDLLLTVKAPEKAEIKPVQLGNPNLSQEQSKVLHKALASKDYFLLVGPPGTGKTKFMLAEMVRYLLENTDEQILLLAYTNRAVDEICEAIHNFAETDYLRIGSKFSTHPDYFDRLFSVQTENIKRRGDLHEVIMKHRIFVSTVASISNKPDLLKLKKFNTTIIDEASQILEPMLVGMLPYFQRFVLIGDHKQLPAVVLQDKEKSAVKEEVLQEIGLHNRRNSLFERLYNQAQKQQWDWAYDMLSHQGRMHGDICGFPSSHFYDGKLKLLPENLAFAAWQREPLNYTLPDACTPLQKELAEHRLLYYNCEANRFKNPKTNLAEAQMVGQIISDFEAIYKASGLTFNPADVGVITPFRAQIAQVRHLLSSYEKGYDACSIDTVERYQGGARDIIIISLCLNNAFQLESIISLSDDEKVDRKLNVALTRARKHLIIVGNESLMQLDDRYAALIKWIREASS